MNSTPPTPTQANRAVLLIFGSIALITLLFGILSMFVDPTAKKTPPPLLVYCATSLRAALEQAAANYQKETGIHVELSFGSSQTLLANIEITKRGDLYLAADDSDFTFAREKNLVGDVIPLAEQTAPELEKVRAKVGIAVLRCSEQTNAALKFAKYLADPSKGLKIFEQQGFRRLNR